MVNVLAFDLMQSESINGYLFNFSESYNDVYSPNFKFLKMDSFSAIMILGPEFYLLLGIFIAFIILKISLCCLNIQYAVNISRKIKNKL